MTQSRSEPVLRLETGRRLARGEVHKLPNRYAIGAEGGTRTRTMSPTADFESAASTNSATPACELLRSVASQKL